MALSYAVVAPLVLPAAVAFFLVGWVVWRYHALYFYQRSYESGGEAVGEPVGWWVDGGWVR